MYNGGQNDIWKPNFPKSCVCSRHPDGYPPEANSMDMARLRYQYLRQQELYNRMEGGGYESFLSPPATVSSSLTTLVSCNSAPPYITQCSSPASSDDFNRQYGSYDSLPNFNFQQNSANGFYYTLPMPFPQERSAVYTAEDVHTVVKNNRDVKRKRIVSNKVFVGGISHSMDRETINIFFAKFGTVFVDWPMKTKNSDRGKPASVSSYSYLFLVYSEEQSVIKLMQACTQSGNGFFVLVPGCRDPIQIRPWFIKNAFYIANKAANARIVDVHRTVFVGGLPRIVTAEEIAEMFSQFGRVLVVTIDIDQDYGYPKGAARVTFERDSAFNKALEQKYLKFENIDSSKTLIEIKPYVMEDVGCDQCGGLWFNPFIDIYDQLKASQKDAEIRKKEKQITPAYDMWNAHHIFSSLNINKISKPESEDQDLLSKIDAEYQKNQKLNEPPSQETQEELSHEKELENGARKFVELTKSLGLHGPKIAEVKGDEYVVGPDLWYRFIPPPSFEVGTEPVQMDQEQKIESFLRMKRTHIYSNKSSYCKEKPCRQYYCPSCSNKLHSGPDQHTLLPAGKPERRPRKDKNMYLVSPNI